MRGVLLVLGVGAMLAGTMPAAAQRGGEKREERREHRRERERRDEKKGDGVGGFVLGALAVGLVAALSAKKPPVAPEPVEALPSVPMATDADAAVSACVGAVEGEGRRTFAVAQAGQVRAAAPFGEGYAVEGDVLLRSGWLDAGERHGFRCTVDAQAVRTVAIEGVVMLPRQ